MAVPSDESMSMQTRIVLEPPRGWNSLQLRDLWNYRELLYFLAWRDVLVRYKQSALGIGWAVIQPIVLMVIFSIVFGRFAGLPSDGIPYPLLTFAALLPWQLFSSGVQRSSLSLVNNTGLLTKVYFPRLIIPLSAVVVGAIDFLVAFVVFAGLMAWYGFMPSWQVLALPGLCLMAVLCALSVSLWLSAINVKYRDISHVTPFLIQAGLFASPVAYSSTVVPGGAWGVIYGLNPMVGIIQGFRWALLGTSPPEGLMVSSVVVIFVALLTGLYYFRRTETYFADVV